MARPIKQIVQQGLFWSHQCVELVNKNDPDGSRGLFYFLFLLPVNFAANSGSQQIFFTISSLEKFVKKESCVCWISPNSRNLLVNDAIDVIWLDQTHAIDGEVSEFGAQFWICFDIRNDSRCGGSLTRPRHSRYVQGRARTFVANAIHNVIFDSFYFLVATGESFRLFAQLHSLDQLFKNVVLRIQFQFIILLHLFFLILF